MRVQFKPWENVEIKAYTSFETVESFLESVTATIPPVAAGGMTLFWSNGVVFRFQPLAGGLGSDELTRNFLKGKLVWENVDVVALPQYQGELHIASKPMFSVKLQDVSRSTLLGPVGKWLSSNLVSSRKVSRSR